MSAIVDLVLWFVEVYGLMAAGVVVGLYAAYEARRSRQTAEEVERILLGPDNVDEWDGVRGVALANKDRLDDLERLHRGPMEGGAERWHDDDRDDLDAEPP